MLSFSYVLYSVVHYADCHLVMSLKYTCSLNPTTVIATSVVKFLHNTYTMNIKPVTELCVKGVYH